MRLFCLVLSTSLAAWAGIARDWTANPAVVEIDTTAAVFVVGDVHGDYDRLVKSLSAAKVIGNEPKKPEKVEWAADQSVVIFMGDLINKGNDSLKVIRLVRALSTAAVEKGGTVIALIGNHEAEFLANPSGDSSRDFASELRDADLDPFEVAACGGDFGAFLCNLPLAARVNDWFFVHAGNTGGRTLYDLKAGLQEALDRDGFASQQLAASDSLLESRLSSEPSQTPNWCEGAETFAQTLGRNTLALSVNHIVQGHEPGKVVFADGVERERGEMFQRDGLLFLVDTGMSSAIDESKGGVMRIRTRSGQKAVAICPGGEKTTLWSTEDRQAVGHAGRCK